MDPGQEEGPSAEELLGLLNGGSADNEERPPPPRASCSSASNEDVDGGTGSAANAAAVPAIATQPQHHPWVPGSPSGPLLLDQRGELSSSPSDDGRNGDSNGGDRSVDDEAQVEDQLPEDSLAVAAHQDADHPAASARKRYCRFPGCDRVVKSQGHCQKHGARAKRCRVPGCDKQAQGTHDGMCKRHWKEVHFPDPALLEASAGLLGLPPSDPRAAQLLQVAQRTANPEAAAAIGPGPELAVNMATAVGVHPYPAAHSESVPVGYGLSNRQLATPIGESVYDSIIPQSVGYRPGLLPVPKAPPNKPGAAPATGTADTDSVKPGPGAAPADVSGIGSLIYAAATPAATAAGSSNSSPAVPTMPLVAFLRRGQSREVGWHRQQERLARGLLPIASLATQLESWERQLALVEILLLSGVTPNAVFRDLAHAWGREKNFHLVLVNTVCSRRGEVERKKRSNAGTRLGKRRRPHQKQEQHKGQPVQEDHERKVGQQVQHHQQDGLEEEDNGVGSSTSSSSPASLSNKRRRPYGPPDLNGGPVGHQEEEDDDNDHYDNDDNSNIPYSEDDHPLPGAEDRGSFAAGAPAPLHSEATGGVAVSDPVATSGQPHLAERDGDDDFGNGGKSIADPLEAAAV